jgi:hypothetical protein
MPANPAILSPQMHLMISKEEEEEEVTVSMWRRWTWVRS